MLLTVSPVLYWTAALATTSYQHELIPVEAGDLYRFPTGKKAEKFSVLVENGRNLYSPFSTILFTENSTSDLANWTKIYFFGFLSLGTMLFASDFPGL